MKQVFGFIKKLPAPLLAALVVLEILLPGSCRVFAFENDDLLGTASYKLEMLDSRSVETDMGDTAADAVRDEFGADMALVGGGVLLASLPIGPVTYADVENLFSEDAEVFLVNINAKQIYSILEDGVSHIVIDFETEKIDRERSAYDAFPQISGFIFKYDATAPVGERVIQVKYGGEILDPADESTMYTLAITGETLEISGISAERQGMGTLQELFADYVVRSETLGRPDGNRIIVIGTSDQTLISMLPISAIVLLAIALFAGSVVFGKRRGNLF